VNTTYLIKVDVHRTPGAKFSDYVESVYRKPRQHTGWQSVTYNNKRYRLAGGIRTPHFITLSLPLSDNNKKRYDWIPRKVRRQLNKTGKY
jgi:hypothetical protein